MGTPFVGEVRLFGGNFAPLNWAFCNGQLLSISANPTLFQLIGTTYGGDGVNTYALPDLQGRAPVHQGTGIGLTPRVIGQVAGELAVTLTQNQIPAHIHTLTATNTAATSQTVGTTVLLAKPTATNAKLYTTQGATPTIDALSVRAVGSTGGSQPHDNMMPSLAVSYIISLFGIFPTQN